LDTLAKLTKQRSLVDVLSIGIDGIQRNFDPMKKQVAEGGGSRSGCSASCRKLGLSGHATRRVFARATP
jgi:hypothetical protein